MSTNKENTASVEELYLKEKKKSNILLASTIVLAVLFAGSLIYGVNASSNDAPTLQDAQGTRQLQGGGPGGRGGLAITKFFDESGAVDQTAVDAFAERASQGGPEGSDPSQFLERFYLQIDTAVTNGEITQTQGDQLKAALGQAESTET